MIPSESDLKSLVGHVFPGGRHRIEHWENFLLTEATGREPMPDDLAHPVHLFHVPIAGAGTSIAELFDLGRAESDASITIDYYDWEYFRPLREECEYAVTGRILEHERTRPGGGPVVDALTFCFELDESSGAEREDAARGVVARAHEPDASMAEDGAPAARATFRWYYWRWSA